VVLLAIVAVAGLLSAGVAGAHSVPTFGLPSEPRAEGFGEVRPATIFLGGDPSGLVSHIHWRRWGKPKAIGRGKGWYIPPGGGTSDGHTARARLVAWDLGYCGGQWAYRKAEWYFPEYHRHGHFPDATYFDPNLAMKICAGHYPY
jgi:hypothetical protein